MSHLTHADDGGGDVDASSRSVVRDLSDVTYILASLFFILSLSGLSKHETATRGNIYGGQHTTEHINSHIPSPAPG
jgi:hypothetical protein